MGWLTNCPKAGTFYRAVICRPVGATRSVYALVGRTWNSCDISFVVDGTCGREGS